MSKSISLLHRYARYVIALLIGTSGVLAFSPFDLWPCAFIAIIGLLLLPVNKKPKQAALITFFWSLGLFGTGFCWIYISIQQFGNMPPAAGIGMILLLAAYSAIYPMLFSVLLTRFWSATSLVRFTIAAPALWQVTEFLRGWVMTGFPWLQFGYSQIDGPLSGLAPITGIESITYVMFILSGLIAYSITNKKWHYTLIAIIVIVLLWPLKYLTWFTTDEHRAANIALVQGNISQRVKWLPDERKSILQTYFDVTSPYIGKSQIIIWPEAAIPDLEVYQTDFLNRLDTLARKHNTSILTGIIEAKIKEEKPLFFNSLIVLGDKTPYSVFNENRYRKHHLVIFGEYVPLEKFLRPIGRFFNLPMSSISSGAALQPPLIVANYKLTPAICYEIIKGEQIRKNFQPDTDFLLTISNDAWFGNSIGPWQHFQMARMRALEFGRPVLRATNTGVTAFIDAKGKVIDHLPQFERSVLNKTIAPTHGLTPYVRFGYLPLWILTLCMLLFSGINRIRDKTTLIRN